MKNLPKAFEGTKFNISTLYELSLFANLAYKEPPLVKALLQNKDYHFLRFIKSQRTMTQGYVAASDTDIIVFFRGTRDKRDILTDIDIFKVPAPSEVDREKVHRGFMEAWESVKDVTAYEVKRLLKEKERRLWITGHSLGAAISGIAAYDLQECFKDIKVDGLYVFGQPRFCNPKFSRRYNRALKKVTFRIVNNNDIVPRVPLLSMGYRHVGQMYYFDSNKKLVKGIGWWEYLKDRLSGKFQDAFDGDIDSLADHSMPLYSKLCLSNM